MVGSHINQGVWSIMHSGSGDANVYSLKLTKPDVRSKYIQANFMNLIDLKLLERQVHKQDFRSPGVN